MGEALGRDPEFSAVVGACLSGTPLPKLRPVAKSSIAHLRPMAKAEAWSNPVTNPPRSLTTSEPSGLPVKAPPSARAKPLALRQGSCRPQKCLERPLQGGMAGIPTGMSVMLDQLIGPPKHSVPYFDKPAYSGRKLWEGTRARWDQWKTYTKRSRSGSTTTTVKESGWQG